MQVENGCNLDDGYSTRCKGECETESTELDNLVNNFCYTIWHISEIWCPVIYFMKPNNMHTMCCNITDIVKLYDFDAKIKTWYLKKVETNCTHTCMNYLLGQTETFINIITSKNFVTLIFIKIEYISIHVYDWELQHEIHVKESLNQLKYLSVIALPIKSFTLKGVNCNKYYHFSIFFKSIFQGETNSTYLQADNITPTLGNKNTCVVSIVLFLIWYYWRQSVYMYVWQYDMSTVVYLSSNTIQLHSAS